MWMVLVHCFVSIISASMADTPPAASIGNASPSIERSCIITRNNLPRFSKHWGEEGWRCTSRHPHDISYYPDRPPRCIPLSWLCKGYEGYGDTDGCGDGEDEGEVCGGYGEQDKERTCTNPFTGETKAWRCRTGKQLCIPNREVCDGYRSCDTGEDEGKICGGYEEHNRTCSNPITGEAVGMRCRAGSQQCIINRYLCDNGKDCDDGEDEGEMCGGYGEQDRHCTNPVTGKPNGLWRCKTGKQRCISNTVLCNGELDYNGCNDVEKEGYIFGTVNKPSNFPIWTEEEEGKICGGYGEQDRTCTNPVTGEAVGWRCKTGSQLCISGSKLCNGYLDCDNGEDEELCGGYGENRTCTNPLTGKAVGWRCTTGTQKCIKTSWLCDGENDCDSGEDEAEICG